MSKEPSEPDRRTNPRQRLLDAVIEHGGAHGLTDASLRGLAESVGTSHRMLIHHFGSREGLLVAVVREVEARQRAALADLLTASADGGAGDARKTDPAAAGRAFWKQLSDPALAPLERLFFELYAGALTGAPWGADLLDGIVDDWVEPAAESLRSTGTPATTARARSRLGVAVTRGLLLDLLATGDQPGVDAAMDEFLSLLSTASTPTSAGRRQSQSRRRKPR